MKGSRMIQREGSHVTYGPFLTCLPGMRRMVKLTGSHGAALLGWSVGYVGFISCQRLALKDKLGKPSAEATGLPKLRLKALTKF